MDLHLERRSLQLGRLFLRSRKSRYQHTTHSAHSRSYSNVVKEDAKTQRLKQLAQVWRGIYGKTAEEVRLPLLLCFLIYLYT